MSSNPPSDPPALRTDLSPDRAANLAENPNAGQGAVMLDVGGDIGAIVLYLSQDLEGAEIEIAPAGTEDMAHDDHAHVDEHEPASEHDSAHESEHGSDHAHGHGHGHGHGHHPHVAVVGRPAAGGTVLYSAVFPDLEAGVYRLNQAGETPSLEVTVEGGDIVEVTWPH